MGNTTHFVKYLAIISFGLLLSCGRTAGEHEYTSEELRFSNETGIDIPTIKVLESETKAKATHLKRDVFFIASTDRNPNYPDQETPREKTVLLPGIWTDLKSPNHSYELLRRIQDKIEARGFKAFFCNGKDLNHKDKIAIVRADDEFTPLVYMQTNGINHNLSNAELIVRLQSLNERLHLKLLSADFEWCEFAIGKEPEDWNKLAEEIYKLCPDVVEQGSETVAGLAKTMKQTKRLYLWFD